MQPEWECHIHLIPHCTLCVGEFSRVLFATWDMFCNEPQSFLLDNTAFNGLNFDPL
jgi:hypothetical protein